MIGRVVITLAVLATALVAAPFSARGQGQVASVVSVFGTVEVQRGGKGDWQPAPVGTSIFMADAVRTSPAAFAKLLFADNAVVDLGPSTQLSIEHYAGSMPVWLAPVQVAVMNITENQSDYAARVAAELRQAGLRVETDLRNEKVSYKIREHSLQKLPYQVIVGDQEVAARKVAVRTRKGEDLGQMSLADFVSRLRTEEARLGRAARD